MATIPLFKKTAGSIVLTVAKLLAGKFMLLTLLITAFTTAFVLIWRVGVAPVFQDDVDQRPRIVEPVTLRTQDLQQIISQRAERVSHVSPSFQQFNRMFEGVPTVTPSPFPSVSPSLIP